MGLSFIFFIYFSATEVFLAHAGPIQIRLFLLLLLLFLKYFILQKKPGTRIHSFYFVLILTYFLRTSVFNALL